MALTMLIDGKNLSMATFHSTGTEINEKPTGIIYGFLEKLLKYQKIINADKFVFCWDSKHYFRKGIYPKYKVRDNSKLTEDEVKDHIEALRQMEILKFEILPRLGFSNVYEQYGFEADDLIAQYTKTAPKDEEIVILSADKDLHQLMEKDSNRIRCYSIATKRFYTDKNVFDEFGVNANQWGVVKAMAGCSSDKVDGIKGVGDKRASSFLNKSLTKGKFYDSVISKEGQELIEFNKRLVILPFAEKRIINLNCERNDLDRRSFIEFFVDYKYFWWLKKKKISQWIEVFNLK